MVLGGAGRGAETPGARQMTDILKITELRPWARDKFAGKTIRAEGTISQYDKIKRWRQRVVNVPAEIPALCEYLRQAREQNVIIIRGAPANVTRQPTLRQDAYRVEQGKDRGDHRFGRSRTACWHWTSMVLPAPGRSRGWKPPSPASSSAWGRRGAMHHSSGRRARRMA